MRKQNRQNFIHGAIILMTATVLVKLIGAVFKIPLANLIGASGMGYFNTAYGLFNPLYALAVAGFPVAVSKMVSESTAKGRYRDARRVLKLSFGFFIFTGLLGSALMFLGGRFFVDLVGNPKAYLAVVMLSPAVFFCCLMSSLRGYYEGLRNMYPTAVSQVVEAVFKMLLGIVFSMLVVRTGYAQFEAGQAVFGEVASTLEEAQAVIFPISAAAAILGVTISTVMGSLYLMIRHKWKGDGLTREELEFSPEPCSLRQLGRRLIKIAIPVCLGTIVLNLTSMIDLVSVMNRLSKALETNAQAVLGMYEGLIPADMELSDVPNYLYGAYTGLAISIFNLVPALTTAFGVSALPNVASAWTVRNRSATRRNIESVLKITVMIAFPAGLGLMVLAQPVLNLLYASRPLEAQIIAPALRVLGLAVIFVAVTTPVNSMLQAVGRINTPVKLMLLGGAIKLVINFIFVAMPSVNIQGAPYGTVACYAVIVVLSLWVLLKETRLQLSFQKVFFKPFLAALMCAASAWTGYGMLSRVFGNSFATLGSIVIAALVYLIFLFLVRAIEKEDILMLPKGEKVAKILEKHRLIG